MRAHLQPPILRAVVALLAVSLLGSACENATTAAAEHVAKGGKLLDAGDLPRATIELKNALRLDPTSPDAHYVAALLAERDERWIEAIGHYSAVIERRRAIATLTCASRACRCGRSRRTRRSSCPSRRSSMRQRIRRR